MITDTQILILQNLLQNKEYSSRVLPFIKREYFTGAGRQIFSEICLFVGKYKKIPGKNEFSNYIANDSKAHDNVKQEMLAMFPQIYSELDDDLTIDYLLDISEKWCQDAAIQIAILNSVSIIDGTDTKNTKDSIPELVRGALSVSFDSSIGHEYFDADTRHAWYSRKIEKIPYGIDILDDITNGGFETKTLNLYIGGTHAGKTLAMCDLAAKMLQADQQVLYITLEISEEKVAQRIDANLLEIDMNDIPNLSQQQFKTAIDGVRKTKNANLIIKEYPNGSIHAGHIRSLLDELDRKKGFKPKVICIDYLNLLSSELIKDRGNTYGYFKSVSEELRSLAMEFNIAIWSATQLNRSGFKSSDPDLGDMSDSFGVAMTADFALVIYQDEHLKTMDQYMCKQEKNRYGDMNLRPRFTMGVNKAQQRLYNVTQNPSM